MAGKRKNKDSHQNGSAIQDHYNVMTDGVKWTERYAKQLDSLWAKMPRGVGTALGTFAVFLLGSTLQGEWIVVMVHFLRQIGVIVTGNDTTNGTQSGESAPFELSLEYFQLKDLPHFIFWAAFGSYAIYFSIGGFIHWYFYVRQRDRAHEWKCQPDKFLSPEVERHEILLGSFSLLCTSITTGMLACYAYNGGSLLTIYYDFSEYGYLWLFLQIPVIFIYQDYMTYWIHRVYHTPFLYKHFHKMHHKYKQPTAFSVTAIHPVEILNIQSILVLPIFIVPIHWAMFYGVALYTYYHGIIDHSGVNFKAFSWQPWQPDAIFHDNHHQYFHVNFAFNIFYWDILHGTYRQKDRIYTEEIFYGKGKGLNEVSKDILMADLAERNSENPLAYRSNQNEFLVSQSDVKKKSL